MLRSLRWKLALLYFSSALGIVVLLAAGTYFMLDRFFIQQVDLALQVKMAGQFKLYGLSLPAELVSAERLGLEENPHPSPTIDSHIVRQRFTFTPGTTATATEQPLVIIVPNSDEHDENESEHPETEDVTHPGDDSYDSRLSSIFVIPVSTPQAVLTGVPQVTAPIDEDIDASNRALSLGYDLRTVHLPDGTHARLLTYRTTGSGIPTVIQIGRLLDDQDRLLQQYLIGLLILGAVASFMITILSWMLSGRSIKPAQKAWDQQQLFIANASHELRAPLTLIRASADYAIRAKKTGIKTKSLKDVMGEVDYMNHLVDDLLLLSRMDTHRLKLDRQEIKLDSFFQEITRQVELIARERGVSLAISKSGNQIFGDPVRTRQVILSLIDNALRFTPPGGNIELGGIRKDN
ncbi:MAG: HAMP domain-containing sensor histidine kinase, partial [Anaerolineaceae bacterium]